MPKRKEDLFRDLVNFLRRHGFSFIDGFEEEGAVNGIFVDPIQSTRVVVQVSKASPDEVKEASEEQLG